MHALVWLPQQMRQACADLAHTVLLPLPVTVQLIMFSYELQRRLRLQGAPVDVFAVHPGGWFAQLQHEHATDAMEPPHKHPAEPRISNDARPYLKAVARHQLFQARL
jgi:NAD(P)-dependent dehydrogenase (short-subunit alcohol dehydrogenase family)